MLTFLLRLSTLNRETGELIVFTVSILYAYFLIETEYFEQRNWRAVIFKVPTDSFQGLSSHTASHSPEALITMTWRLKFLLNVVTHL